MGALRLKKSIMVSALWISAFLVGCGYGAQNSVKNLPEKSAQKINNKKSQLTTVNKNHLLETQNTKYRAPASQVEVKESIIIAEPEVKAEPVIIQEDVVSSVMNEKPKAEVIIEELLSFLKIEFGANYQVIESLNTSNNTKATLVSESQPELNVAWENYWSSRFKSHVGMNMTYYRFQEATEAGKSVESPEKFAMRFSVGGSYDISSNTEIALRLGFGDFAVIRSITSTSIEPFLESLTTVDLGIRTNLIDRRSLQLFSEIGAGYAMGSSADIVELDDGSYWSLGLGMQRQLQDGKLSARINYQNAKYSGDNQEIKIEWLRFLMSYGWDF